MENNENNNVQPTVEENKPLESSSSVNASIEQPKVDPTPVVNESKVETKPDMPNNPKDKKNNKKIITAVTCSVAAIGLLIGAFFIGRNSKVIPTPEPQPEPVPPVVETTYTVVLVPGEGHFETSSSPILINDVKKDTKLNEIKGYSVPTHELLDFSNWTNKGETFDATTPIVENTVLVANFVIGPRYAKNLAKQELNKQLEDNTKVLIDHGEGDGEAKAELDRVHLNTITIIDSNRNQSVDSIYAIKNLSSDIMNKVADTDTPLEQRLKVSESYNHLCENKLDDDLSADELVIMTGVIDDYIQVIEEDPEIDDTNIEFMDEMFDDIKSNVKKADKKKKKISKKMAKGAIKSASKAKDRDSFELLESEVLETAEQIYENPELKEEDINELSDLSNSYIGGLSKAKDETEMEQLEGYFDSTKALYFELSKEPTEKKQLVYEIRKENLDGFSNLDNSISLKKTIESADEMQKLFEDTYENIKDASAEKKEDYVDIAKSFSKAIIHQEDKDKLLYDAVDFAYKEMLDDDVYEIVKDDVMYGMNKVQEMPSMDTNAYFAGADFATFNGVLKYNVGEIKKRDPNNIMGNEFFQIIDYSLYDSMLESNVPLKFVKGDSSLDPLLKLNEIVKDKLSNKDRVNKTNEGDSRIVASFVEGLSRAKKTITLTPSDVQRGDELIKFINERGIQMFLETSYSLIDNDLVDYKVAIGKAFQDSVFSNGLSYNIPWFATGDLGSFMEFTLKNVLMIPDELSRNKDNYDYCMDYLEAMTDRYNCVNLFNMWDSTKTADYNYAAQKDRIKEIYSWPLEDLFTQHLGTEKFEDAKQIYRNNFMNKLYFNIPREKVTIYRNITQELLKELSSNK